MVKFKCKSCGNEDYYLQRKGPNIGLYCSQCHSWVQWVSKTDVSKYEKEVLEPLPKTPIYNITYDEANSKDNTGYGVTGPRGASLNDPVGLSDDNGPRGLLGNGATTEDILKEMKRLSIEAEQIQTKMRRIVKAFQYYNTFLEQSLNIKEEEDDVPPWD